MFLGFKSSCTQKRPVMCDASTQYEDPLYKETASKGCQTESMVVDASSQCAPHQGFEMLTSIGSHDSGIERMGKNELIVFNDWN